MFLVERLMDEKKNIRLQKMGKRLPGQNWNDFILW